MSEQIFAIFAQKDKEAIDTITDPRGKDWYNCFSKYVELFCHKRPENSYLYIGVHLPTAWGSIAIEQIDSMFSNIKISIVTTLKMDKILPNPHLHKWERLKTVKERLKYYEKTAPAHSNAMELRGRVYNTDKHVDICTYLLKIEPSDGYTWKSLFVLNKLIAIMFRVISPEFGYLLNDQTRNGADDYLDLVCDTTKKNSGGDTLSISETIIDKQYLLNIDNIDLMNKYSEGVPVIDTYYYSQTKFLNEIEQLRKFIGKK